MHPSSAIINSINQKPHPKIQLFLNQLSAITSVPLSQQTISELRVAYESFSLIQGGIPPRIARVEDASIPNHDGRFQIPIRVYTPKLGEKLPALLYFHGGGWQRGSITSHDVICRNLAIKSGCIVVSVDWRLAPEHKFPVGFNDAYDSYHWLLENGESAYNVNTNRIAVGGDSAGGNLSAALCLKLRNAGEKMPVFQLLLYPSLDLFCTSDSYDRYAEGYMLTTLRVKELINTYIDHDDSKLQNPLVSPLQEKSMHGLPPTHVMTAEFDPLCDEGQYYAEQLKLAGVPVSYQCCEGMIHAFLHMIGTIPEIEKFYDVLAEALIANINT